MECWWWYVDDDKDEWWWHASFIAVTASRATDSALLAATVLSVCPPVQY
jgi:hypothetical protein